MKKDYFSDGVLVYDRYYCVKPNTVLLVIKRILLTAAFCVCSMMYVLSQYGFPVSLAEMAAVCGISCIAFSTLFVFVKKRFALPVIFLLSGLIVWWTFEPLIKRLSYFADGFLLLMEGRFFDPQEFLFHTWEPLNSFNSSYMEGIALGTVLLCVLYSLIVSACCSKRPVLIPPALIFIGLCVPRLISERLEFSFWLVPALAALAGLFAIGRNYYSGLAVNHGGSWEYRRKMLREERTFLKNISKAPLMKRTEMRCNYYSKYFSSGMYCAALVAVCLLIGASIFPAGSSIDYTAVYEFFSNIGGEATGIQSPFDDGTASEYFTHNGGTQQEMLNIISPGRGDRDIIRVDYTGSRPVYLRGDIGIDFTGSSWTTVVGSEPRSWAASGLKEAYRPCEGRVIAEMINASQNAGASGEKGSDGADIITSSDISIEYLCDTDVVFLPPYTAEYSFYNSDSFDVYADYAVRVSEQAGSHINSVECTALLPSYMNNETHEGDPEGFAVVEQLFAKAMVTPNDIYSSVIPEMTKTNILRDYESYVENTYTSIPYLFSQKIRSFIESELDYSLSYSKTQYNRGNITLAQYRYETAAAVAEFLRTNYTYSLEEYSGSDPVMNFLTTTKRGHCALYASAMTLILRELGIPARYCTGFYVEGDNGSNTVVLKEKNLHAWVEVYTGQLGWVTFDPTSSAAYPGRGSQNASASEETKEPPTTEQGSTDEQTSDTRTTESEIVSTTQPEQTSDHGSQSGSEEHQSTEEAPRSFIEIIAPFLPAAAAVILLGVVAAMILSRLNRLKRSARRTLERLRRGNSTDSSRRILWLILKLLEFRGITPANGEMPQSFWRRADAAFETHLEECSALLEAMEFGCHDVSEEDRAALYSQLELIIAKIKPFGFPGNVKVLKIIRNCSRKSGKM